MERMSEIERNALKSYNTIGNASVAGYHQTHADAEKKQANFLALGCCLRRGVAAIGVLVELIIRDGTMGGWRRAAVSSSRFAPRSCGLRNG